MARYEGITYKGTDIEFEDLKAVENAAEAFSTSQAYATGDYCTNDGTLYQFVADHSAGAWNAEHVRQVHISDKLNELDDQKANVVNLKAGTIETADYHLGFYIGSDGGLCQANEY